jgi:hypothetical protein
LRLNLPDKRFDTVKSMARSRVRFFNRSGAIRKIRKRRLWES